MTTLTGPDLSPQAEKAAAAPKTAPARTEDKAARARSAVATWLFSVAGLIWAMAMVGAATRLTESGLSITEWAPITGAIPPLSDAAWAVEFEKYKRIPEFRLEHSWMTLADFKTIYWWEWGHRQLGRFIGFAYALPLAFFLVTGRVARAWIAPLVGLLVLGGLQGAAGWFMVASGLAERTDVSHYRLVLHLGLAAALFAGVLWAAMAHAGSRASDLAVRARAATPLAVAAGGVAGLIYLQILSGGFVAGLNAGLVHNTWPLMDGALAPATYWAERPWWANLFDNHGAVQFNHRTLAYGVVAACLALGLAVWRKGPGPARGWAVALGLGALGQTMLGVVTLLNLVPTPLGVAHQGAAFALFAVSLALVFRLRRAETFAQGRKPEVERGR